MTVAYTNRTSYFEIDLNRDLLGADLSATVTNQALSTTEAAIVSPVDNKALVRYTFPNTPGVYILQISLEEFGFTTLVYEDFITVRKTYELN